MAIIFKNAPKTEEGRRLNLTKEQEEEYRIVFRFDKGTKKLANIEPWSAEEKYDNYCAIAPLSSIYDGPQGFDRINPIRNVQGSDNDKNPYCNSWLTVIRVVYGVWKKDYNTHVCCLDCNRYKNVGGKEVAELVPNHGKTVIGGGHVIGLDAESADFYRLPYFYLLPICQSHNNPSQNAYYFRTTGFIEAVKMKNTLIALNLRSALLNLADSVDGKENIEFDVKKYCEENGIEVKDMFFD